MRKGGSVWARAIPKATLRPQRSHQEAVFGAIGTCLRAGARTPASRKTVTVAFGFKRIFRQVGEKLLQPAPLPIDA